MVASALLLAPRVTEACASIPFPTSAFRTEGVVSFVGVATPDTARAGPGATWHGGWLDRLGLTPRDRAIHGQVVRVRRLPPSAEPALVAAVRGSGGRVVLVPWANSTTCARMRWDRSARWLPDTAQGLFTARLRDRRHWAGGLPTFDLSPWGEPYDGSPVWSMASVRDRWLTPDELLDLLALGTTYRDVERDPDAAVAPLRRWAAANPVLATREPAKSILASAEYVARDARVSRRTLDLAGTWRVTVVLPVVRRAGDPRTADTTTFWVRTARRPEGESDAGVVGLRARACVARSERRLAGMRPFLRCHGLLGVGVEGSVVVGDEVRTDAAGRRRRAGDFDVIGVGFMARRRRVSGAGRRVFPPGVDLGQLRLGTFTEWPDGRATFESFPGPPGASIGRATAVRVSRVALPGD